MAQITQKISVIKKIPDTDFEDFTDEHGLLKAFSVKAVTSIYRPEQ